MNVGQLRKELEGVADDVPVVAIPKGGQALSDRLPTISAFCVGDRTDSYVGAFAIEIAQTVVGVLGAELLADDPHAPAPGTASAFRRAAEPMPSSYGKPRNVALDQGYGGVDRQQRQAEADIKREASSHRVYPRDVPVSAANILDWCDCAQPLIFEGVCSICHNHREPG